MEDTLSTQQQTAVSLAQDATKKPYSRPELIRYGDLKTLTQSNLATTFVDFEGWFS